MSELRIEAPRSVGNILSGSKPNETSISIKSDEVAPLSKMVTIALHSNSQFGSSAENLDLATTLFDPTSRLAPKDQDLLLGKVLTSLGANSAQVDRLIELLNRHRSSTRTVNEKNELEKNQVINKVIDAISTKNGGIDKGWDVSKLRALIKDNNETSTIQLTLLTIAAKERNLSLVENALSSNPIIQNFVSKWSPDHDKTWGKVYSGLVQMDVEETHDVAEVSARDTASGRSALVSQKDPNDQTVQARADLNAAVRTMNVAKETLVAAKMELNNKLSAQSQVRGLGEESELAKSKDSLIAEKQRAQAKLDERQVALNQLVEKYGNESNVESLKNSKDSDKQSSQSTLEGLQGELNKIVANFGNEASLQTTYTQKVSAREQAEIALKKAHESKAKVNFGEEGDLLKSRNTEKEILVAAEKALTKQKQREESEIAVQTPEINKLKTAIEELKGKISGKYDELALLAKKKDKAQKNVSKEIDDLEANLGVKQANLTAREKVLSGEETNTRTAQNTKRDASQAFETANDHYEKVKSANEKIQTAETLLTKAKQSEGDAGSKLGTLQAAKTKVADARQKLTVATQKLEEATRNYEQVRDANAALNRATEKLNNATQAANDAIYNHELVSKANAEVVASRKSVDLNTKQVKTAVAEVKKQVVVVKSAISKSEAEIKSTQRLITDLEKNKGDLGSKVPAYHQFLSIQQSLNLPTDKTDLDKYNLELQNSGQVINAKTGAIQQVKQAIESAGTDAETSEDLATVVSREADGRVVAPTAPKVVVEERKTTLKPVVPVVDLSPAALEKKIERMERPAAVVAPKAKPPGDAVKEEISKFISEKKLEKDVIVERLAKHFVKTGDYTKVSPLGNLKDIDAVVNYLSSQANWADLLDVVAKIDPLEYFGGK